MAAECDAWRAGSASLSQARGGTGAAIAVVLVALSFVAAAWASPPPVPDGAVSLREDVFVEELRPGVWRHVSFHTFPTTGPFPSNGLIVRAEHGAVLIDTAWNPEQTAAILDWTERHVGPVRAVFVTHAHVDRLGGLPEVHRRGIQSLGLQATTELAVAAGGPAIGRAFASGFRLEPYGVRGEVFFPGAGHSVDNAVVFLEDALVLMGTCMVREAATQTLGNTRDADLASWPAAIERLQKRYQGAELVVPGHGSPGGSQLLEHTLRLLAPRPE